ncbi:MAG: hypothetical protein ABSF67_22605 [Roseiarcus sp.]|jgi:hypothetical protein
MFEDKIVAAIGDTAASVGDSIEGAIDAAAERIADQARESEYARLDVLTGAPRGHSALMAHLAARLDGDAPKSLAQRRREIADSEAVAALMNWPVADVPRNPAPLDIAIYQVDDAGNRTRVLAAPDVVEQFEATCARHAADDADDALARAERALAAGAIGAADAALADADDALAEGAAIIAQAARKPEARR